MELIQSENKRYSPTAPCGPATPLSPGLPSAPCGPIWPWIPCSPFSPWLPVHFQYIQCQYGLRIENLHCSRKKWDKKHTNTLEIPIQTTENTILRYFSNENQLELTIQLQNASKTTMYKYIQAKREWKSNKQKYTDTLQHGNSNLHTRSSANHQFSMPFNSHQHPINTEQNDEKIIRRHSKKRFHFVSTTTLDAKSANLTDLMTDQSCKNTHNFTTESNYKNEWTANIKRNYVTNSLVLAYIFIICPTITTYKSINTHE